ncbi:MAG: EVE domain-containing protein [Proteobacteria bacterium]|nr:EVE domain-containing protein [Pseudomonadota bacterium]
MNYWLVKSEPGCWSWQMQTDKGHTDWDGVRNYQASNNLKAMAIGDLAFFYHSVVEKRIVGIVKVTGPYVPDPTDETGRFGMVRMDTVAPLVSPVTLEQIKHDPRLCDLPLVRQSRLSVMPIPKHAWDVICALGQVQM